MVKQFSFGAADAVVIFNNGEVVETFSEDGWLEWSVPKNGSYVFEGTAAGSGGSHAPEEVRKPTACYVVDLKRNDRILIKLEDPGRAWGGVSNDQTVGSTLIRLTTDDQPPHLSATSASPQ